jgi:hypothetical protein
MSDGMVRVVINPALASRVPSPVMARVHEAERAIEAGRLVPVSAASTKQ